MTSFPHSLVLFTDDGGLPLEFNLRNANEKATLKALIEYGGGICCPSESAVHLVNPDTKVLNASLGKKLVSCKYILDCVNANCLLDVNDYVLTVNESQTSDISDEDCRSVLNKDISKLPVQLTKPHVGRMSPSKRKDSKNQKKDLNLSTNLFNQSNAPNSSSESFVEGTIPKSNSPKSCSKLPGVQNSYSVNSDVLLDNDCSGAHFASTAKDACVNANNIPFGKDSLSLLSPIKLNSQTICNTRIVSSQSQDKPANPDLEQGEIPLKLSTIVSSSHPGMGDLDEFDNSLLAKAKKNQQDEENLSQSYTVSSSADALPKPNSAEIDSADVLGRNTLPDSPGLGENEAVNVDEYMKRLEQEVEEILSKPSPRSIQDKTILVKYILRVLSHFRCISFGLL